MDLDFGIHLILNKLLSQRLSISPSMKPGLFGQLNEAYFRRVETMEFAFRFDDGQHPDELDRAEIIIVGVSRTFKTPLSIYLALKSQQHQ